MTTESLATPSATPVPPGPLREFWSYFRANRGAVAGLCIVVTVLLVAAFAEVLAPYPPNLTNNAAFLRPDTGVGSGRPPMAQRALLLEHGGFDESFRNYAVDSEMWIRYAFVTRMTILREPLVLRRVHPGTVSGDLAQDALNWLRIMDRLESTHPEFVAGHGALMRRTRGKQHLRLGRERLARCAGDAALLADARRHLRRAVALWPRFVRAWAYLAWSHLAPDTYSTFRKAELNNRS